MDTGAPGPVTGGLVTRGLMTRGLMTGGPLTGGPVTRGAQERCQTVVALQNSRMPWPESSRP